MDDSSRGAGARSLSAVVFAELGADFVRFVATDREKAKAFPVMEFSATVPTVDGSAVSDPEIRLDLNTCELTSEYVSAPAFCEGRENGDWCAGTDLLVACSDGTVTEAEQCFGGGCRRMLAGTADLCDDGSFCQGKENGQWCDGLDLVTCDGNFVSRRQQCNDGCSANDPGVPDECL